MKEIKIITVAVITTIAIILSCACIVPACAEDHGEFYPKLTVVVDKEQIADTNLWIVYCQDKNGNVWAFYDDKEEWNIGDIANLLMWNMSEREEDDEIIEVYWEGYTEDIDSFFQMDGWR